MLTPWGTVLPDWIGTAIFLACVVLFATAVISIVVHARARMKG